MRATIHVFTAEQRQREATGAGVAARPYGPPPRPPEITKLRLQETGNATRPLRIVPESLEFGLGQNVTMRVWNDASQTYTFRVDFRVDGVNETQPIPPFENRTMLFTINTLATGHASL